MKNWQFAILVVTILVCAVVFAAAQTYGSLGFATIAPAVANCPAGLTNGTTFCTVGTSSSNYAVYVSFNAAPYQLLVPASTGGGVTSFGNPPRTGAVVLTKADVLGTGAAAAVPATTAPLQ